MENLRGKTMNSTIEELLNKMAREHKKSAIEIRHEMEQAINKAWASGKMKSIFLEKPTLEEFLLHCLAQSI